MHPNSYRVMDLFITQYLPNDPMLVADLGSFDVNGTYRPLIEQNSVRTYVGIDIVAGKNVDILMPSEYEIPVESDHFDHLISGSCFEHVRNPFKLMKEASRIVKPGGFLLLTAPFVICEHRYPVDCWRILSDGWQALFDESGIEMLEHEYAPTNRRINDSWAIGRVNP